MFEEFNIHLKQKFQLDFFYINSHFPLNKIFFDLIENIFLFVIKQTFQNECILCMVIAINLCREISFLNERNSFAYIQYNIYHNLYM